MSDLQQTIQKYHTLLVAYETSAHKAMASAFSRLVDAVRAFLSKSHTQADTRQFIISQATHFSALVQGQTSQLQAQGTMLGSQAATEQIQAVLPDMAPFQGHRPHTAQAFSNLSDEAASKATDALAKSTHDVIGDVVAAIGFVLPRATMYVRTVLFETYRQASVTVYIANNNYVDGWIWITHMSSNTCKFCKSMHGTVHPLTEEFESHANCNCTTAPNMNAHAGNLLWTV